MISPCLFILHIATEPFLFMLMIWSLVMIWVYFLCEGTSSWIISHVWSWPFCYFLTICVSFTSKGLFIPKIQDFSWLFASYWSPALLRRPWRLIFIFAPLMVNLILISLGIAILLRIFSIWMWSSCLVCFLCRSTQLVISFALVSPWNITFFCLLCLLGDPLIAW